MNRKLDWPVFLLFAALLFGAIVRFWPGFTNGFPLNDGGMFYTMIRDLKANHYFLPEFTRYNDLDIPFAYPPFGFYVAASFSDFLPVSELGTLLWLPAVVNTLSIFFFYKLAGQLLNSRLTASLATLVYALSPRAFLWQVMGGGITRSFGMMFLILMLWQAALLFKSEGQPKPLALTILFGAGAILSHPQTALHAVLGGALIFLFYGRNLRGILSVAAIGLGVALLTAPWWGIVLLRHGIEPLISASQTGQQSIGFSALLLQMIGAGNSLALPMLALFYIGLWISIKRKDFFFVAWIVLAYLIDTRGGDGIALLPQSMLAGAGLLNLVMWISRSNDEQDESMFMKPWSQALVFGAFFLFMLAAVISDFQLVNTSLKAEDLKMIEWVNANVEENQTFLLSTGREFSMSDPMQEWFPALTQQHSITTLQGLEWTLDEWFFPWHEELVSFQHCANLTCVSVWSKKNRIDYDYLLVVVPPAEDRSEFAESLRSLAGSARASFSHTVVYESENTLIFELEK